MAPYCATNDQEMENPFWRYGRGLDSAKLPVGPTDGSAFGILHIFCAFSWLAVYNEVQLSLTHKQLKVGIANQRHPLTSSESSIAQLKKQE
jgi:hypothetical protein